MNLTRRLQRHEHVDSIVCSSQTQQHTTVSQVSAVSVQYVASCALYRWSSYGSGTVHLCNMGHNDSPYSSEGGARN